MTATTNVLAAIRRAVERGDKDAIDLTIKLVGQVRLALLENEEVALLVRLMKEVEDVVPEPIAPAKWDWKTATCHLCYCGFNSPHEQTVTDGESGRVVHRRCLNATR